MRMLENEGFAFENYVDIFDGGPTMIARTDQVRSIAEARSAAIAAIEPGDKKALVAAGTLGAFRAGYAMIDTREGGIAIDEAAAAALELEKGSQVEWVARW